MSLPTNMPCPVPSLVKRLPSVPAARRGCFPQRLAAATGAFQTARDEARDDQEGGIYDQVEIL
jgi:hypothetical protein